MSYSDKNLPDPTTLLSFHKIAAERGDGLLPGLAEALVKSGYVSGPPPASEPQDDNIVRPVFGRGRPTGTTQSKAR
ncbi:hypothetical protein FMN50_05060 [Rhodobacterales bacterium]|nr:hypothetical protein FMN50_05060 [Rhodobacterales bacterium]